MAINKRLSSISSNEAAFNQAAPAYQKALQDSGYEEKLSFEPPQSENEKRKNRKRKIIWFNPPFSSNVSTNIGAKFLKLIDECFPPEHKLSKIFNRNSLKISYRCTPNMMNFISGHNNKVSKDDPTPPFSKNCNCQKSRNCPLNGECLTENIIYQATVKIKVQILKKITWALLVTHLKLDMEIIKKSFNQETYSTDSTLSSHIW